MSTQNEDFEKDDPLADLFSDSKETTLKEQLPTRGKVYPGHSGYVTIRPMNFSDEQEMAKSKGDALLDLVIDRCVDSVDVDSLLSIDKLFLLYKIREASFGNDLTISTACTKCGNKEKLSIELDKLPIDLVEDDFNGTSTFLLPSLNKEVSVRIPTSKELSDILDKQELLQNLWRFVDEIGGITDKKVISQAIKRLTSVDLREIQKSLELQDFGIQTKAIYKCSRPSCGEEHEINIPIHEG